MRGKCAATLPDPSSGIDNSKTRGRESKQTRERATTTKIHEPLSEPCYRTPPEPLWTNDRRASRRDGPVCRNMEKMICASRRCAWTACVRGWWCRARRSADARLCPPRPFAYFKCGTALEHGQPPKWNTALSCILSASCLHLVCICFAVVCCGLSVCLSEPAVQDHPWPVSSTNGRLCMSALSAPLHTLLPPGRLVRDASPASSPGACTRVASNADPSSSRSLSLSLSLSP